MTDDARLVIGFKCQVSPHACIFIPTAGVIVILQRDSIFDMRVQYANIMRQGSLNQVSDTSACRGNYRHRTSEYQSRGEPFDLCS